MQSLNFYQIFLRCTSISSHTWTKIIDVIDDIFRYLVQYQFFQNDICTNLVSITWNLITISVNVHVLLVIARLYSQFRHIQRSFQKLPSVYDIRTIKMIQIFLSTHWKIIPFGKYYNFLQPQWQTNPSQFWIYKTNSSIGIFIVTSAQTIINNLNIINEQLRQPQIVKKIGSHHSSFNIVHY